MITHIKKSTVLVASLDEIVDNFTIYGSGFLVSIKEKTFAVTCRHVARHLEKPLTKFIIPNPKKTTIISNVRKISYPVHFNSEEPFVDVSIMELFEYSTSALKANGISIIQLDSPENICTHTADGDSIMAIGYSGEHWCQMLENKPDEEFSPHTIIGKTVNLNFGGRNMQYAPNNIFNEGFDTLSLRGALTHSTNVEGMSGGPVINRKDGCLCGIIMGGGTVGDSYISTYPFDSFFVYTPVSFLLDLIRRYV